MAAVVITPPNQTAHSSPAAAAATFFTTRVSVGSGGTQGNATSFDGHLTPDARYIVFASNASNLVPNDTNGSSDIFVHDRQTNTTTRVSVASNGDQGNGGSFEPSISANGQYVTFESLATNLVADDTNDKRDIFAHNRQTGVTIRISVDNLGIQANDDSVTPRISADGNYVAFSSFATNLVVGDTNGHRDIFLYNLQTDTITRVSVNNAGVQANALSNNPVISGDGSLIAFESSATNLVDDDSLPYFDVFVHDRVAGKTIRVSLASDGTEGNLNSSNPSISADGRYVAFQSTASNLVANDTNGFADVFVRDLQTEITTRVSISSGGLQADATVNANSFSISPDGRYVAFHTAATKMAEDDENGLTDAFIHDRQTGITTRVSVSSNGLEGNQNSTHPMPSNNATFVLFQSVASNLVPNDTNASTDLFVHFQPNQTFAVYLPALVR